MLAGGLPLLCLEWASPDDRLGKLVPAGLCQPVAPGIVGSIHGSTGVAWDQCKYQDKLDSSAALLTSRVLLWPFLYYCAGCLEGLGQNIRSKQQGEGGGGGLSNAGSIYMYVTRNSKRCHPTTANK